ncbi:site-2 protease family protein [Maricaulis salignorans]|uniref:Zinc metalloprotease n=1 Tax=Maricaulis salignorans TaxID=144026 RepID=A0A1G9TX16_9PROT|nr:site-2 protease family protein [Maricaulis salignorans]SDM52300.1 Zn-dependent protease (includes SpoIVFB) [Maricaulis salignorans]
MRPYLFSFKIGGVVVRAEPSWLFLALLVGWSLAVGFFPDQNAALGTSTYVFMAILGVFGLTFSIIAHELAHTFVGRALGMPINRVTLFMFGGAAELEEEPKSPMIELVMALAGPLMSLFLALVFSQLAMLDLAGGPQAPLAMVLAYLGLINLLLGLFNMLPAFPLDGGRVLRALIWLLGGDRRKATRWASLAGEGFAVFFILAGIYVLISTGSLAGLWWVLIGFFLRGAAKSSRVELETRLALGDIAAIDLVTPDIETADAGMTVADFIAEKLVRHHRDWFAVTDGERLVGRAGLAEAQAVPLEARATTRLSAIAIKPGVNDILPARAGADRAFAQMQKHHLLRVYLLDGERFAGTLSMVDLLEYARLRNLFADARLG